VPHSHVCHECCLDLARVRARPEPRYRLPIVTCPRCGTVHVRREHPIARRGRAAARIALASVLVVVQLGLLAGLVAAATAVCVVFGDPPRLRAGQVAVAFAIGLGLLPIAVGAWLTAGLPHWRRAVAFAAFALLVALLLAMDVVALPFAIEMAATAGIPPRDWIRYGGGEWRDRLAILAVIMTVATAGIPVGALIVATWRRLEERWRRAARTRRRARRVPA
jgi:hypothetical protein